MNFQKYNIQHLTNRPFEAMASFDGTFFSLPLVVRKQVRVYSDLLPEFRLLSTGFEYTTISYKIKSKPNSTFNLEALSTLLRLIKKKGPTSRKYEFDELDVNDEQLGSRGFVPILDILKHPNCNLTKLSLRDNQISNITGLGTLTQLEVLDLSLNQITNITGLTALTKLEVLALRDNQIKIITGLGTLTQLKILDLSLNQITNIAGLATLTELEALDLSLNQITNITGLAALTQLKQLDLIGNQINCITVLSILTQLRELDIRANEISFTVQMIESLNTILLKCCIQF